MNTQVLEINGSDWRGIAGSPEWTAAVEAGKVLYFPRLAFVLEADEKSLLRPDIRDAKSRNISLNVDGSLKGAAGDEATRRHRSAWRPWSSAFVIRLSRSSPIFSLNMPA